MFYIISKLSFNLQYDVYKWTHIHKSIYLSIYLKLFTCIYQGLDGKEYCWKWKPSCFNEQLLQKTFHLHSFIKYNGIY